MQFNKTNTFILSLKHINEHYLKKTLFLLLANFSINLMPALYSFVQTYSEQGINFLEWAPKSDDVIFLIFSTVFISFIEYVLVGQVRHISIIAVNFFFGSLLYSYWALLRLRPDWIEVVPNGTLKILLSFFSFVAMVFYLINILALAEQPNRSASVKMKINDYVFWKDFLSKGTKHWVIKYGLCFRGRSCPIGFVLCLLCL